MLQSTIRSAADSYFSLIVEQGVNWYPEHLVPAEMRASEVDQDEGLVAWKPMPSQVRNTDVAEVEAALKTSLSPQFVELLGYKHFMELHLGDMWLFAHPLLDWQDVLIKQVFESHPRKLLIDKGFLPFAGWSDWGRYCFSLNQRYPSGEYAVYQWDHSDPENFHFVAESFNEAIAAAISR
jgi:hypothetical protein